MFVCPRAQGLNQAASLVSLPRQKPRVFLTGANIPPRSASVSDASPWVMANTYAKLFVIKHRDLEACLHIRHTLLSDGFGLGK